MVRSSNERTTATMNLLHDDLHTWLPNKYCR